MDLEKAVIVAGVGCRRGAAPADVEAAIRAALARAGISAKALGAVATIAAKQTEAGIKAAAENLNVCLVPVSADQLKTVNERIVTRSERVQRLIGVPSVAEAAALAAAGPHARLISARLVFGAVSCALAASGAAP